MEGQQMILMPKKHYVLRLREGGLQEVVFVPKPRLSLPKAPSKALRAGVLSRMAHRIFSKRKKKHND
jgi:hypothetical protein